MKLNPLKAEVLMERGLSGLGGSTAKLIAQSAQSAFHQGMNFKLILFSGDN